MLRSTGIDELETRQACARDKAGRRENCLPDLGDTEVVCWESPFGLCLLLLVILSTSFCRCWSNETEVDECWIHQGGRWNSRWLN